MTDIGKGDLVRSLINSAPFHEGQVLTVSACGSIALALGAKHCVFCGPRPLDHWLRFEGVPCEFGLNGFCAEHFRKLSGPPSEAIMRETELDNPFLAPKIHA